MTISLALVSSPRTNEPERTQVLLLDDQGQLLNGALVTLALTAPDGTTTSLALDEVPQGGYERNDVVFSTAGTWTITITADLDGREHQATFTRTVED